MKKRRLESFNRTEADLPDYSADWWLLEGAEDASSAEIEARFYYEFARESETILHLTEGLSQGLRPLELGFQWFAMVQGLVLGYVLGAIYGICARSVGMR